MQEHAFCTYIPGTYKPPLTQRKQELLRLMAQGLDDSTIAHEMGIARVTVGAYIASIKHRLDLHTREDIKQYAQEHGYGATEGNLAC